MKRAAVSRLKARLASYIRMVKSGEQVEIQERGVPVAILAPLSRPSESLILPPRRDPRRLSQMKFSTSPKNKFEVVDILLSDRRRR